MELPPPLASFSIGREREEGEKIGFSSLSSLWRISLPLFELPGCSSLRRLETPPKMDCLGFRRIDEDVGATFIERGEGGGGDGGGRAAILTRQTLKKKERET